MFKIFKVIDIIFTLAILAAFIIMWMKSSDVSYFLNVQSVIWTEYVDNATGRIPIHHVITEWTLRHWEAFAFTGWWAFGTLIYSIWRLLWGRRE